MSARATILLRDGQGIAIDMHTDLNMLEVQRLDLAWRTGRTGPVELVTDDGQTFEFDYADIESVEVMSR